jgi:uncharacterized iron-regulated protein
VPRGAIRSARAQGGLAGLPQAQDSAVRGRRRSGSPGFPAWLLASLAVALQTACTLLGSGLIHLDHPLAGHVWDVREKRFVEPGQVVERAREARFVLLGETHDNAEHHRIQAMLFYDKLSAGLRPALVMEQFDTEFQAAIDAARSRPGATAESVADAGRFNRAGWDWTFYEPLVRSALEAGVPIVAANLSRAEARRVGTSGFAALGEERAERLDPNAVWSEERQKTMVAEIVAGHCGQAPEHVVPAIASAQRARDAVMADSLAQHAQGGAVGIIGRGHARRDLGVPLYLARMVPDADVLVLAMVEVVPGKHRPEEYLPPGEGVPPFDFLWFTPRADRPDPCEPLRRKGFPGASTASQQAR